MQKANRCLLLASLGDVDHLKRQSNYDVTLCTRIIAAVNIWLPFHNRNRWQQLTFFLLRRPNRLLVSPDDRWFTETWRNESSSRSSSKSGRSCAFFFPIVDGTWTLYFPSASPPSKQHQREDKNKTRLRCAIKLECVKNGISVLLFRDFFSLSSEIRLTLVVNIGRI